MTDVHNLFQPQTHAVPNHQANPLGEGRIAGYSPADETHQKEFISGSEKRTLFGREKGGSSVTERAFTTKGDGTSLHAGLKMPVLSPNATEAEKQAALHSMTNSLLGGSSLNQTQYARHRGSAESVGGAPNAQSKLSARSSGIGTRDFGYEVDGDGGDYGMVDPGYWGYGGGGSHHSAPPSGGSSGSDEDDGGGVAKGKVNPATVAHGMPNSHLGGDTSNGNWTTNGPIGYIDDNWKYIETCEAVDMNYKLLGTAPTPEGLNDLVNNITEDNRWNYQWGGKHHRGGDDGKDMRGNLQTMVANSSQAHDLIKQIYQDYTGTAPDEKTISSWQEQIRKSKATISTIKDQVAHSQATADHLKDTLNQMTGDPSRASDHFAQYYQNELAGDKDWNTVYNELLNCNELNGWLHDETKFMTGDDATDSQMNYYHERLRDGDKADAIKHDIAYGAEARQKIDQTLTYMTGDASLASDHFTQYYQEEMYKGTSWDDIHNQILNCNELNGWLHDQTKFMTGKDATDAQMSQYHDKLNAGEGADTIKHDIAYSDAVKEQINGSLTYMTGDPSLATDHFTQWYQDWMYHGASWDEIHNQILNSNELNGWLHDQTKFMTGKDATDAQMAQYHDKLNAGNGSDTIKHDIAYSDAVKEQINGSLTYMTGDPSLATDHFTQWYQDWMYHGASWDEIHNQLLNSNELNGWLHDQTKFMTGKDATDAQMAQYHDTLNAGEGSDTIKHDIAYSDAVKEQINGSLTYMTGDPSLATDHFTQWYQDWMYHGASWDEIHNQLLNCNELNGWLHDQTKFMTGDDATDSQMNYYHERLRDGKSSTDIKHDIAYGSEAKNKIDETLTVITGDPSLASDHFTQWYQNWMDQGASWDEIYNQILNSNELNGWLHDQTKFMTGDDATDSQMNYYHERLHDGDKADAIKHDIAYGAEARQKIDQTLTYMTGDVSLASDHFTQYYQEEMYKGTSWDEIYNQILNCNELNGWLHDQTKFMTGKDATDAQMAQYHDKLNAGEGSNTIKHDIAYSDAAKEQIDNALTYITGDPSLASDHFTQWYQNEMYQGTGWEEMHNQILNCNEVNKWLHDQTKLMTGTDATDAQMAQYHDKLNAGNGSDTIKHDIAYSDVTQNKINETLASYTQNSVQATDDFKNRYSAELAQGKDWKTVQTEIGNSPEVANWKEHLTGNGKIYTMAPVKHGPIRVDVIDDHEGGSVKERTKGYVPDKNSGATIGYGIDLHAHTRKELHQWGYPDKLLDKIPDILLHGPNSAHPGEHEYGLTGNAAGKYLTEHSLTFTENEVDYLSSLTLNAVSDQIGKHYDHSNPSVGFDDLPENWRTVIVDLAYPLGQNFCNSAKYQTLWQALIDRDVDTAVVEIKKYEDNIGHVRADDDIKILKGEK